MCATVALEEPETMGLSKAEQFRRVMDLAEEDGEPEIVDKSTLHRVFDEVRERLGAATPDGSVAAFSSDEEDDSSDDDESNSTKSRYGATQSRKPVDSDDSDSESDDDDNVVVYPGVKRLYDLPQIDFSKPLVYSIPQMLGMIPEGYDALKERIGLFKTVSRFIPTMSNRRARAVLFKRGIPLSSVKRTVVRLYRPPVPVKVPFGGKPIRVLAKIRENKVVRTKTTGEPLSRQYFLKQEEKRVVRLLPIPNSDLIRRVVIIDDKKDYRVLGGRAYPRRQWIEKRIDPQHKKYFYFLRRNGRVYRSVHHPYPDEDY